MKFQHLSRDQKLRKTENTVLIRVLPLFLKFLELIFQNCQKLFEFVKIFGKLENQVWAHLTENVANAALDATLDATLDLLRGHVSQLCRSSEVVSREG